MTAKHELIPVTVEVVEGEYVSASEFMDIQIQQSQQRAQEQLQQVEAIKRKSDLAVAVLFNASRYMGH